MNAVCPIITLTTDCGLSDPYVGTMKGVILSINREARIVDVSHDIRPQRIEQGAFVLGAAWPYFPAGSVHVAVVDPGVGGKRKGLVLATPQGFFVGPDNGVLSAALPDSTRQRRARGASPGPAPLPEGYRAVAIGERRYLREPLSATFHGRDVFAPVAAHLTLGVPLESLGKAVSSVMALPPFRARRDADDRLAGRVIHIDRFGNLVTDIREGDLGGGSVTVEVLGRTLRGLSSTYGDGHDLLALVGSSGYLEVALPAGNAAQVLKADLGTPVVVRPMAGT